MINRKCSARSTQWLQKRFKDQYTKQAYRQRLRSRAWFKLDAIDRMDSLFYTGMRVVDLGSAPGGWTLYVKNKVGNSGYVVGCDILSMRKIDGVDFIKGDCSDPSILQQLHACIGNKKVHVVLSDMSPNITGISIIDVNRSMYLGSVALDICRSVLMRGGTFLVKVFQGRDLEKYLYDVHCLFDIVKIRKPNASNISSNEVYIMAKKHKYN